MSVIKPVAKTEDYKIADLSLAPWGRKHQRLIKVNPLAGLASGQAGGDNSGIMKH